MNNIRSDLQKNKSAEQQLVVPQFDMPEKLVFIRHGQSQLNIVSKARRDGIISEYPEEVRGVPDREFHLSKLGEEQAIETGKWLKEAYPEGFDVIYVSDYVRAQETAALICKAAGWENVELLTDPMLGEINYGTFHQLSGDEIKALTERRFRDPYNTSMPNGETHLEGRARSRILQERISREYSGKKVLAIAHGEYIKDFWAETGHFSTEYYQDFFNSDAGTVWNCQVIEFTAADPASGEWDGHLRWYKSSCPCSDVKGEWTPFEYQKRNPDETLEAVKHYPRLDSLIEDLQSRYHSE